MIIATMLMSLIKIVSDDPDVLMKESVVAPVMTAAL